MKTLFFKYHGAGNDFVVIDNRNNIFDAQNHKLIEDICHRRFGVGADGLMLLENAEGYDFRMKYFNSDGYEASMCGNGGRCIVAFAQKLGLISDYTRFVASDGPHEAHISPDGLVDLHMSDVKNVEAVADGYFLNTGVPHLVHFVDDLHLIDVNIEGRQLRWDARFQPDGTNVNFVKEDGNHLTVYTYERGVEAETLAFGTGITASALSAATKDQLLKGEYHITAKGGTLSVKFRKEGTSFVDVWLKGPAKMVFSGELDTLELSNR